MLDRLKKYLLALGITDVEVHDTECAAFAEEISDFMEQANPEIREMLKITVPMQQLIASGERGKISVIYIGNCVEKPKFLEMYCLEGELFEDVCRCRDIVTCGRHVYSLLNFGKFDSLVESH